MTYEISAEKEIKLIRNISLLNRRKSNEAPHTDYKAIKPSSTPCYFVYVTRKEVRAKKELLGSDRTNKLFRALIPGCCSSFREKNHFFRISCYNGGEGFFLTPPLLHNGPRKKLFSFHFVVSLLSFLGRNHNAPPTFQSSHYSRNN